MFVSVCALRRSIAMIRCVLWYGTMVRYGYHTNLVLCDSFTNRTVERRTHVIGFSPFDVYHVPLAPSFSSIFNNRHSSNPPAYYFPASVAAMSRSDMGGGPTRNSATARLLESLRITQELRRLGRRAAAGGAGSSFLTSSSGCCSESLPYP